MIETGVDGPRNFGSMFAVVVVLTAMTACTSNDLPDSPYPPGFDPWGEEVDPLVVAHRLMESGEYELALNAFSRAALKEGMTTEIVTGMGTANLGLGRLGQSEKLLRRAVEEAPDWPEAWNNLGVVLVETGQYPEAALVFKKAYALDNGKSDAIRDNLQLALAKMESPATIPEKEEFKLVQRGQGDFVLRRTP